MIVPSCFTKILKIWYCFMIEYLRQLNMLSMTLRIVIAVLVGGLIGLERELKGRSAGFRTYMLVALGSTLTMILSQYLDLMMNTAWIETSNMLLVRTDVSRLGAQVINGVGFLGAGAIIVTSNQDVKGLTTAAGLWSSACIGLAVGAGFYECVVVAAVLLLLSMSVLPIVENKLLSKSRYMNISVDLDSLENLSGFISNIKNQNIIIYEVDINKKISDVDLKHVRVFISMKLPFPQLHESFIARLSSLVGVIAIEEV